jgi:acetyl-CoA C-acetyltransferase
MNNLPVRKVAIIGGNRIPFAPANKAYARASNRDMLTATLNGLVERYQLQGERIGEVVAGAVAKHAHDVALTRESVLDTELSAATPCYDIQQACGTGLEAAILVANKIALGQIDSGIAGGSDSVSDAPIGANEGLRKLLLELNGAKTTKERLRIALKLRPSHVIPNITKMVETRTGLSMGEHCEVMAKEWGILQQDQDMLALASHQNLAKAYNDGFMEDLISPFLDVERDLNLRANSTLEKMASLGPVFDKSASGTLTAANSTPLTDGASCVLLASEEWAKERDLPIRAYLTFAETSAVDYYGKEPGNHIEGLLMAPAYAVPRMLEKAGITLQDFDFYEIHEAFAAQVLCTLKAWEDPTFCKQHLGLSKALGKIDRSKLNVRGSSLAAGHPFAATGGRIVSSLAKLLEENNGGRGLISICAAGGMGVTAILER